jgi:ceramide glucosyltransferase
MPRASAHSAEANDVSMLRTIVATGCLIWFVVVWFVCGIGFTQL